MERNIFENNFMICPKNLRNPYTNKIFDENTLNYIYFSAFKEMLIISTVITELFNSQFNRLDFIYSHH